MATPARHLTSVPALKFDDGSAANVNGDEERAAYDWLHDAPTVFLLCRNDHRFPRLEVKNGKLARGIRVVTIDGDLMEVRIQCPDCTTVKYFEYRRGTNIYLAAKNYKYEWPEGYRMPHGATAYVNVAQARETAYNRQDLATALADAARPAKP